MKKINCIVIEDEPLAQERICEYIRKLPNLSLTQVFENAQEALLFLKKESIDLIFLDINLGSFSGIDLLETGIQPKVIITTAYNEYALRGYEFDVVDYLMKPFNFQRFCQAVNKVENLVLTVKESKNFIFIKTEHRLEKISFDEILYIEGMRDYRRIHTNSKKIMTLQTFKELEDEIPTHLVCRVHKSYMVSLSKIESIERERIKIQDKIIPISESYKKHFFSLIHKI